MDPVTIIFITSATLAAMGAIAFWDTIMEWVQDSLLPWFQQELPGIATLVAKALSSLDTTVVAIRRQIIAAWKKLRPHLLKLVVTFERSQHGWVRRTATYLRKHLEPDAPVILKKEEVEVPWHDLPDDIREMCIREGKNAFAMDVTKDRDREIAELET